MLLSASYWKSVSDSARGTGDFLLEFFFPPFSHVYQNCFTNNLLLVELKGKPLQFNLSPPKLDLHVSLPPDKDCDPPDGSTPFEFL